MIGADVLVASFGRLACRSGIGRLGRSLRRILGRLGLAALLRSRGPVKASAVRDELVEPGGRAVDPLEDRYRELDDLDNVESVSRDGVAVIAVEFVADADAERKYEEVVRETNPIKALWMGSKRAYSATIQTYLTIKHLIFTREVGVQNVSGPVGILRRGSQIAEGGLTNLIWFLGIISANLAVINFLPMPIVDGGLFIFLLLEKIRGEPVSIRTQVVTQLIGIALIVSIFLIVTFQDIANWNR